VVLYLIAALLLLPIVELWAFVAVAGAIGLGWAVLLMVALSVLGVVLIRSEGLAVWRRANNELAAGRMPARSIVDGAMVLLGGCLLIVPGFVTAAVGLLLLLPPTRAALRPLVLRWMGRRAARSGMVNAVFVESMSTSYGSARGTRSPWGTVIGGTVVDVDAREAGHAEVVDVRVDGPRELDPPA
jgi:UPF0716 protein FxsA